MEVTRHHQTPESKRNTRFRMMQMHFDNILWELYEIEKQLMTIEDRVDDESNGT